MLNYIGYFYLYFEFFLILKYFGGFHLQFLHFLLPLYFLHFPFPLLVEKISEKENVKENGKVEEDKNEEQANRNDEKKFK